MRVSGILAAALLMAMAFVFESGGSVLAGDGVAPSSDVPLTVRRGPVNDPNADTAAGHVQHTPTLLDLGGGKLVTAFYDLGSNTPTNRHLIGYAYSSDNGVT